MAALSRHFEALIGNVTPYCQEQATVVPAALLWKQPGNNTSKANQNNQA
jgi:hypothetical protein